MGKEILNIYRNNLKNREFDEKISQNQDASEMEHASSKTDSSNDSGVYSDLCQMQYVKDALGQEMLLKDGKFQVMMEWEKPYMQACIDALKPRGDVLEVGFGCGYSATHIQTYHPKSHTIIEYHPVIAQRAREWAKDYSHVTIIEDTWQHALPRLGVFDCIFFDERNLSGCQF